MLQKLRADLRPLSRDPNLLWFPVAFRPLRLPCFRSGISTSLGISSTTAVNKFVVHLECLERYPTTRVGGGRLPKSLWETCLAVQYVSIATRGDGGAVVHVLGGGDESRQKSLACWMVPKRARWTYLRVLKSLRVGIVVTDMRPRVRLGDSQIGQLTRSSALELIDDPRSACRVRSPGSIACLEQLWAIKTLASRELSWVATIQPTT